MIDTSTALQTVAALSSAAAAIAAFWVARNAFTFQKNSLLKTATVAQIIKLLQQLYYLKSLAGQPVFGARDEDVTGLWHSIAEAKSSYLQLAVMVSPKAGREMEKVRAIVYGLHEGGIFPSGESGLNASLSAKLDEAIDALLGVYRAEMK